MRKDQPMNYKNHPNATLLAQSEAHLILAVIAGFTLLIGFLGYSPWIVFALPASAFLVAIVARDPDYFGSGVCVLLTISLSYYYSLGQIAGLVTVIRVAIILMLVIALIRSGSMPTEYKFAAVLFGAFLIVSAATSYFRSIYVNISELKLIFAGLFFMGLFLSAKSTISFPGVLFGVITSVVLLSTAVFILNPLIGYAFVIDPNAASEVAGKFSGILNHPQLLACLLAVNLPLILHTYLNKTGPISTLALVVLVATSVLIALSSSRTGLLAVFAALFSMLYFLRKNPDPAVRRRVNSVWAVLAAAIIIGCATSFEQIQQFIYKSESVSDGIRLSGRDEIVYASWQGFTANPGFGNGFQVPSEFTEHGGATFGISSDATSVEKCFFVTMLLEEVGLVGTLLFFAVLGSLIRVWYRKKAYAAIAAMLAFLTINIGEACILSPSSIGGLCWLSIFAVHNLTFRPDETRFGYDPHRRGLY